MASKEWLIDAARARAAKLMEKNPERAIKLLELANAIVKQLPITFDHVKAAATTKIKERISSWTIFNQS